MILKIVPIIKIIKELLRINNFAKYKRIKIFFYLIAYIILIEIIKYF